MSYLRAIEISRIEMSGEDSTFTTSNSKKGGLALIIIKFVELCLLICLIGLIDEPATHSYMRIFMTPRVVALCYVAFGSLLIYTAIFLITAMIGELTPWRTAALWAVVAFCLFLATTALLFRDWSAVKDRNFWHPNMQRLDLMLASASISLVAAVLFLIDIVVTVRVGDN